MPEVLVLVPAWNEGSQTMYSMVLGTVPYILAPYTGTLTGPSGHTTYSPGTYYIGKWAARVGYQSTELQRLRPKQHDKPSGHPEYNPTSARPEEKASAFRPTRMFVKSCQTQGPTCAQTEQEPQFMLRLVFERCGGRVRSFRSLQGR